MIDFDALVLQVGQDTFGIPVVVTPLVSNPMGDAYNGRGIWTVREVDITLEDGAVIASKSYELSIRQSEYPIPPKRGDNLVVNGNPYTIDQVRPDGQGALRLVLKALSFNTD